MAARLLDLVDEGRRAGSDPEAELRAAAWRLRDAFMAAERG